MQLAAHPDDADPRLKDLREALPLYAASLVVTLAGIGAVGVTLTTSGWMPLWALLAVMGHGASLGLRYARVNPETIFYPVMLFGSVVIVQQSLTGLSPGGSRLSCRGSVAAPWPGLSAP